MNLPAVQICVIEVIRKGLFRRSHVQAHDLPDELPQGLGADLRFIVLSGAHLAPEDTLQRSNVLLGQWDVSFQLGNHHLVLVLADIELRFGFVVL